MIGWFGSLSKPGHLQMCICLRLWHSGWFSRSCENPGWWRSGHLELETLARFLPPSWPRPVKAASWGLGQPARTCSESRNTVSSIRTLLGMAPELTGIPMPASMPHGSSMGTAQSTGHIVEDRKKAHVRRWASRDNKKFFSLCLESFQPSTTATQARESQIPENSLPNSWEVPILPGWKSIAYHSGFYIMCAPCQIWLGSFGGIEIRKRILERWISS